MICSQSRKYSLSRRLFTFFEYIIHPIDKYCQRFPLPLPLFSVGLCLLLSFHSPRLSTERLFCVKTEADGKSPSAPPLIATQPRTSPAFLDANILLHFDCWIHNHALLHLHGEFLSLASTQQKATPLTGVTFAVAEH